MLGSPCIVLQVTKRRRKCRTTRAFFICMNSRILETILIDWSKLKDLQPEGIKTSENEQALRESLQKYGFVVPFYVWKDSKGILWTIDGHTRKKVLKDMQAPKMLQATLIQAKNKKEAQGMLIEVFNQRQNGFVIEVLEAFIQENELEVDIESVNVYVEEVESGGLYEEYEEAQQREPQELTNMIAISLTDEEADRWSEIKQRIGKKRDKDVFFQLLITYENATSIV